MKLKLNQIYSKSNELAVLLYKVIGMVLLSLAATVIIMYAILFLFYAFNRSWVLPIILTPTSEQVLNFRSRQVAIESAMNTQSIYYHTAKEIKMELGSQLSEIEKFLNRNKKTIVVEATFLDTMRKNLESILPDEQQHINDSQKVLANSKALMSNINQELQAGLITKTTSAKAQIELQTAMNAVMNMRIGAATLEQKINEFRARSKTLQGGISSLEAISHLAEEQRLIIAIREMKIKIATAISTLNGLTASVSASKQFLDIAKNSPYYEALKKTAVVIFVPYKNLGNLKIKTPIYDCYLQILICRRVGTVKKIYQDEYHEKHPLFRTETKGLLALVVIEPDAAQSLNLFIGRRPLLL